MMIFRAKSRGGGRQRKGVKIGRDRLCRERAGESKEKAMEKDGVGWTEWEDRKGVSGVLKGKGKRIECGRVTMSKGQQRWNGMNE